MTSAQAVAAEVRANLARQRISGRQAALRLGWTPPYLSRRLIGEIPFDVADLQKMADLLDLPVTAFFDAPQHQTSAHAESGNLTFPTPLRRAA
jgi:transcriptional regulator with XRE-family HTH domain